MDTYLLPTLINRNSCHILNVNKGGTICAYGTKTDIVLLRNCNSDNPFKFDNHYYTRRHPNRVLGVTFITIPDENNEDKEHLASFSEEGIYIWRLDDFQLLYKCIYSKGKLVDIDKFCNSPVIVAATDIGNIIKWDLILNKATVFTSVIGHKFNPFCLSSCPHDEDLIAVGGNNGLVVVYNLKDKGRLLHKMRCHDTDVVSLAWCPVPYNALDAKTRDDDVIIRDTYKQTDRTLLLASCSRDRNIYISKAGTNGYCETIIPLPGKPLFSERMRTKICSGTDRTRCVKWIFPYTILVTTDYGELAALYIDCGKSKPKCGLNSKLNKAAISVKYNFQLLQREHRKSISCMAVPDNMNSKNFQVWTTSYERFLARYDYDCKTTLTLPLLSGFIYYLCISPVNPDLLAIATGDSKIIIWNLSTKDHIDITILSQKIDDRVMSLRWHPVFEGVLAFGTGEGRVGIFDISSGNTSPVLLKTVHSKPIYKLYWMLDSSSQNVNEKDDQLNKKFHLLAIGNGDIWKYNPLNCNEVPISLQSVFQEIDEKYRFSYKTEICYQFGSKLCAVGLSNGNVYICDSADFKVKEVTRHHRLSVMSIAWHPKVVTTSTDKISPCSNWLATASDVIVVYNVDPTGEKLAEVIETYNIHLDKVFEINWSPHHDGQLLSVSANHTAVIWDVVTHTMIACYNQHQHIIYCGIWHPFKEDLVLTGSLDGTCRIWNIYKDAKDTFQPSLGPKKERKHKKPLNSLFEEASIVYNNACELPATPSSTGPTKSTEKAKPRQKTLFPTFGREFCSTPKLDISVKKAIEKHTKIDTTEISSTITTNGETTDKVDGTLNNGTESLKFSHHTTATKVENNTCDVSNNSSICNKILESNPIRKQDISYLSLFGNQDEVNALSCIEETTLNEYNDPWVSLLSQSRFQLKDTITEAMKKNTVTECMLALAPSISPKLWKDACAVYIEQLIVADNILQAANFLIALNKLHEAIKLLCNHHFFKEAFLIARTRVCDDSTIKDVAQKWASFTASNGNFRMAAHCFLFLNDEVGAANILCRSKSRTEIAMGAKLMKYYDQPKARDLALVCFKDFMLASAWKDAEDIALHFKDTFPIMNQWYLVAKYLLQKESVFADVLGWLKYPNLSGQNIGRRNSHRTSNSADEYFTQTVMAVSHQVAKFMIKMDEKDYNEALHILLKVFQHCYTQRISSFTGPARYLLINVMMFVFKQGPDRINFLEEEPDNLDKLLKSIKAFVLETVVDWLLRYLPLPNMEKLDSNIGDIVQDNSKPDDHKDIFVCLTKNQKVPIDAEFVLQEIDRMINLYLRDFYDSTIKYYNTKFDLNGTKEIFDYLTEQTLQSTVHNGKELTSLEELTTVQDLNPLPQGELDTCIQNGFVEQLQQEISICEEHVPLPNPYTFYNLLLDFLNNDIIKHLDLTKKIREKLTSQALECGLVNEIIKPTDC